MTRAAAADALGKVVEGRGHTRLAAWPRLVDGLEEDLEVALHRARRHVRLGLVVVEQQADRIALLEHEVRQRGR